MPNPIAVERFEAVWDEGIGDGAKVPERSLLVEAKMLQDVWAVGNALVLDSTLVLEYVIRVEVDVLS